ARAGPVVAGPDTGGRGRPGARGRQGHRAGPCRALARPDPRRRAARRPGRRRRPVAVLGPVGGGTTCCREHSGTRPRRRSRLRRTAGRPGRGVGPMSGAVTVVVATRNRAGALADTLTRLTEEHDSPIIVVDNASRDDTAAVAARFADRGGGVRLIRLDHNAGAAARTVGVRAAATEYVAFADDDSWFAPGSLDHAAAVLGAHPDVGLIVARTVVEPGGHDDPIESALRRSPLGRRPGLPGPEVLGFLACAVVMRTRAYLAVGGFSPLLWFGSEETLLAYDLDAAGWALCHVPAVVAHHRPSPDRPAPQWRRRLHIRNDLLISWLRRPLSVAGRHTAATAQAALGDADRRAGLRAALVRAPQAGGGRRLLPRRTEGRIVRLSRSGRRPAGTRVRPAAPSPGPVDPRATVVTIIHNRRAELHATLTAMREGRDAMAMIVVDNGS